MPLEEIPCSSVKSFVETLRPNNALWGTGLDNAWIYRGHSNTDWNLQPRAWREDGKEILGPFMDEIDDLVHKQVDLCYSGESEECRKWAHEMISRTIAELKAVENFARFAIYTIHVM